MAEEKKAMALAGVRVVDLTHCIAGPYCTKLLAGFGADVIKIERPGTGDPARGVGPFLDDEPGPERSGLFLYLNSGKKGITLNLKSSAGVRILKELVEKADVVVESFRPGVMKRLGLDYSSLQKISPHLIMTSISNFGQTGPYRDYKSAHIVTWGMSGAEPMRRPTQGPGWVTHCMAGVHAAVGTAFALYERRQSGHGQQVDVSMLESAMLLTLYPATRDSYAQAEVSPAGYGVKDLNRISTAFLQTFPCRDGVIGLNAYQMVHWQQMCAFFGVPELLQDPRFESMGGIIQHLDEARAVFAPLVKDRQKMELLHSGQEWRMPFAVAETTEDICRSPQHQARGFFMEIEHPVMGRVTMPGAPFKMMRTPWQLRGPAPLLGQHNEEVYCGQLGYSRAELVTLREQGVI
jgi:crotonobetainyl-CoA:carnitine CoA-transferase CaiB-like acyl-CoA transferase